MIWEKMMELKILVITHKEYNIPIIDGYVPMMVGAVRHVKINEAYLRDDVGDNISEKNDSYCELTGLYWLWKNNTSEYTGLVHYRRYFANVKKSFIYRGRYVMLNKKAAYSILTKADCDKLLSQCDVIVKETEKRKMTNQIIFTRLLGEDFWKQIRNLIAMEFVDYLEEFEKTAQGYTHLNCNMFIGKKSIMDEYCQWLFSVLDRMDQLHIEETKDRYHNRELGYLGELLFEVWLKKNHIQYEAVPAVNIDDKYSVNGVMNIPEFVKFFIIMAKKHLLEKQHR